MTNLQRQTKWVLPLVAALVASLSCDRGTGARKSTADPGGAPAPEVERQDPIRVSPGTAQALIDSVPGILVVDVRTIEEYEEGRLPGSRRIELGRLEAALDGGELPEDPSAPLLVYCRTGRRSAEAAALLAGRGYTRVFDLEGGITEWSEAGLPVTR